MTQVRIALTISGAIALGAFEGGALAALLVAAQSGDGEDPDNPEVVIDAIAGASAGSITGVLAAFSLLEGVDPVAAMRTSWVVKPQLEKMRAHDDSAPLTMDTAHEAAREVFALPRSVRPQRDPVWVSMAVVPLRGLQYEIPLGTTPVDSNNFLEWRTFRFDATSAWRDPAFVGPVVDVGLASGSHLVGFPPAWLPFPDGGLPGVTNLPAAAGGLWYTDGGTVQNEPLGQSINLAGRIDAQNGADSERIFVLIHPHPDAASAPSDPAWAWSQRPTWDQTFGRALGIHMTQSIFEDIGRIVQTNARIAWVEEMVDSFERQVPEPEERRKIATALQNALPPQDPESGRPEHRDDSGRIDGRALAAPPAPQPAAPDLGAVLRRVAGVAGKRSIRLEVVSPAAMAKQKGVSVERLLSGEFLGHFGGFVNEDFRQSDFVLGWLCMEDWLQTAPAPLPSRLDAVRRRRDPSWNTNYPNAQGDASLANLSLAEKAHLLRLGVHVANVARAGFGHDE